MSMHADDLPLTGGCNCEAVRFEVLAPLVVGPLLPLSAMPAPNGTGASINARAAPGAVRILQGRKQLRAWKPKGRPREVVLRRMWLIPVQ